MNKEAVVICVSAITMLAAVAVVPEVPHQSCVRVGWLCTEHEGTGQALREVEPLVTQPNASVEIDERIEREQKHLEELRRSREAEERRAARVAVELQAIEAKRMAEERRLAEAKRESLAHETESTPIGQPRESLGGKLTAFPTRIFQSASCENEELVRSGNGRQSIHIRFRNASKVRIHVYWLTHDGKRRLYRKLDPQQSYLQQTYLTHPWLITDSDDKCVGIVLPLSDGGEVTYEVG